MVVKPLNARTASAIAARNPPAEVTSPTPAAAGSKEKPAAHSVPSAKIRMPATFKKVVILETEPITLLPAIFTRKAKTIRPTPSAGTRTPPSATPKARSVYVPKVRATRLSLMTIESAIIKAAAPATVEAP